MFIFTSLIDPTETEPSPVPGSGSLVRKSESCDITRRWRNTMWPHHTHTLSHTHRATVSRRRSQQAEDAVRLPWFQPPASWADRCVRGRRLRAVRIYDRTEGRRRGGKEGRRRLWQQEVLKGGLSLPQKNIRVIVSSEFRPSGSSITPSEQREDWRRNGGTVSPRRSSGKPSRLQHVCLLLSFTSAWCE